MNCEVVDSGEGLCRLEALWTETEKAGNIHTPFQSFAWADQWMRHRGRNASPYVLIIDEGKIIVPLALYRVLGIRILRILGTPDSDYLGLITSLEPFTAWDVAMSQIWRLRAEWDLLHLHSVHEREAIIRAVIHHTGPYFKERVYEVCPFIKLDGSWDDLMGKRKNLRRELKRWTRRLEEMGEIKVEVRCPPLSDRLLEELTEVEQASWKWETGNATFKPGSWCDFVRAILKDSRLPIELWLLRLSEKLVAFQLIFVGNNRWYYYMTISRKDYPHTGSYLLAQLVRNAFESCGESVDLLRGSEEYKHAWTDLQGQVHEMVVPSSIRGYLLAMAYQIRWYAAKSRLMHQLRNYLTGMGDRRPQ